MNTHLSIKTEYQFCNHKTQISRLVFKKEQELNRVSWHMPLGSGGRKIRCSKGTLCENKTKQKWRQGSALGYWYVEDIPQSAK